MLVSIGWPFASGCQAGAAAKVRKNNAAVGGFCPNCSPRSRVGIRKINHEIHSDGHLLPRTFVAEV